MQFLPPHGGLEQEALADAVKTDFEGIPTSVLSAEHLVAIALKTGRGKDYARIVMFLEVRQVLHLEFVFPSEARLLRFRWRNAPADLNPESRVLSLPNHPA